jgi:HEAT repeat protein
MIGTGRYDYDWEAQRALERLMERDDIPRLLEHNNPNVRQAAVSALGRIAGRQAISKLLTIMEQEKKIKDSQVYRVACNAFLSVASRDEMPTILALIKDEGYHTGAVGVFARLANRQEISDLLRSGGKRVREALLQALRRVPNREAIPVLKNLFKNPDRYVRRAAVEAFSTVANQQDIPDIKALFQDRSSTVRDSAEKALAAAIKGLGINELNNLKKDENQTLRRVAAKQLAREDGHKDVSVLLDACGDPGSDVRQASAQGLLKISKIDDLTSIAQRAARYSATGTGREVLSVLLLLDRKFFAPTELKQGEEDQRRSLWQLGYRSE